MIRDSSSMPTNPTTSADDNTSLFTSFDQNSLHKSTNTSTFPKLPESQPENIPSHDSHELGNFLKAKRLYWL